jgi:hypothetical protein
MIAKKLIDKQTHAANINRWPTVTLNSAYARDHKCYDENKYPPIVAKFPWRHVTLLSPHPALNNL